MKKHNKLVRDNMPRYIESKGEDLVYRIADKTEYFEKLKEKLIEEVKEFNQDESMEEFTDVLEVLDAILKHKDFSIEEINNIKAAKAEQKGKFDKRFILDEA